MKRQSTVSVLLFLVYLPGSVQTASVFAQSSAVDAPARVLAVGSDARHLSDGDIVDVEVMDITYRSDGLDVPGVLLQPRSGLGRKWPGIVYNRGGTGDYGRIDTVQVVELYLLARAGLSSWRPITDSMVRPRAATSGEAEISTMS